MAAALKPHIAILFEFPTLNGGEHSMLGVLRQLRLDGTARVSAIAPPTGPLADQLRALEIPLQPLVVRSSDNTRRSSDELRAELIHTVQELRADLLHANSLSMSRLVGAVSQDLDGVRCTGHIRDIMKLSGRAIQDLNRLHQIAAVSQATRSFHCDQGLSPRQTQVVYNGVDHRRFCRNARAETRTELLPRVSATAQVMLNVGQICLRKGQLDLAHAVVRLLRDGMQDLHLVLVGERHSAKQESVEYEQAILQTFAGAGYTDHLHCPGYCDNVEQWMNAADLLVHPARQEPLGRVLLEAAVCELPIVATNVGGTPEILPGTEFAFLVPPADVSSLVRTLQTALNNSALCESHARRAARHVQDMFSLHTASSRLLEFWDSALQ